MSLSSLARRVLFAGTCSLRWKLNMVTCFLCLGSQQRGRFAATTERERWADSQTPEWTGKMHSWTHHLGFCGSTHGFRHGKIGVLFLFHPFGLLLNFEKWIMKKFGNVFFFFLIKDIWSTHLFAPFKAMKTKINKTFQTTEKIFIFLLCVRSVLQRREWMEQNDLNKERGKSVTQCGVMMSFKSHHQCLKAQHQWPGLFLFSLYVNLLVHARIV